MERFKTSDAELQEMRAGLAGALGQEAVDTWIAEEAQTSQEVLDGTASCPGYMQRSRIFTRMLRFFDGEPGVQFDEFVRCGNPVLHDPAFRKRVEARRSEFEKALEAGHKS